MGQVCGRKERRQPPPLEERPAARPSLQAELQTMVLQGSQVQPQSELTGRRRSLLIGINYHGQPVELQGCTNALAALRPVLAQLGFADDLEQMRVLADDGRAAEPTRENMTDALRWLVEGVQCGDALFLMYCGHGGREFDDKGSEMHVESLLPVDYRTAGKINDQELFDLLVRPLPGGVKLFCLLDCCHSAGALNLPYLFTATERNIFDANLDVTQMAMNHSWTKSMAQWEAPLSLTDLTGGNPAMGLGLWNLWKAYGEQPPGDDKLRSKTEEAQNANLDVGEIICISAYHSDHTAACCQPVVNGTEGWHRTGCRSPPISDPKAARSGGMLTSVFTKEMQKPPQDRAFTYLDMLWQIRSEFDFHGYSMVPQLSTSLLVELKQPAALTRITLPAAQGSAAQHGVDGFVKNIVSKPAGREMVYTARAPDGSRPWAGFRSEDLAPIAQAVQERSSAPPRAVRFASADHVEHIQEWSSTPDS